jgi:hypothetical protein
VNEKGFPLKYTSVKEIVGHDVACKAESATHLRAEKMEIYRAAPCAPVSVQSDQVSEQSSMWVMMAHSGHVEDTIKCENASVSHLRQQ